VFDQLETAFFLAQAEAQKGSYSAHEDARAIVGEFRMYDGDELEDTPKYRFLTDGVSALDIVGVGPQPWHGIVYFQQFLDETGMNRELNQSVVDARRERVERWYGDYVVEKEDAIRFYANGYPTVTDPDWPAEPWPRDEDGYEA
jgi:hypothetical protein